MADEWDEMFAKAKPDTTRVVRPDSARADTTRTPQKKLGKRKLGGMQSLVDALPALGGMAGGAAGGFGGTVFGAGVGGVPGAMGGAALGGAGGEAARQLINQFSGGEAPQSSGEAARDIAVAGGLQGGIEGAGMGAAKVMGKVAEPLMRSAIGRGLLSKTDVAQTALREVVPATRRGLDKVWRLIRQEGTVAKDLLARETRLGRTYSPVDGVRSTFPLYAELEGNILPQSAREEFQRVAGKVLDENPGDWTPTLMQKKRQSFDQRWRGLRKKIAGGEFTATDLVEEKFYKGMADWSRDALHQTIPDLAASDARQATLVELKNQLAPRSSRALDIATKAAPSVVGGLAAASIPGTPKQRLEHGVIGAAAASPTVMSHAALALGSPAWAQILPLLARGFQAQLGYNP